ncbi:MAG: hypothetical protein WC340_16985, partial [Kiritimatiellia bacterium]
MARFARNNGYLGIGKQSLKGTSVVPSHYLRYQGAPTISPAKDFERYQEGGDSQFPGFTHLKRWKPDGKFDLFVRPNSGALLFALLMGEEVTTGTASDPAVTTTVSGTEAVGQTVITVTDESG